MNWRSNVCSMFIDNLHWQHTLARCVDSVYVTSFMHELSVSSWLGTLCRGCMLFAIDPAVYTCMYFRWEHLVHLCLSWRCDSRQLMPSLIGKNVHVYGKSDQTVRRTENIPSVLLPCALFVAWLHKLTVHEISLPGWYPSTLKSLNSFDPHTFLPVREGVTWHKWRLHYRCE